MPRIELGTCVHDLPGWSEVAPAVVRHAVVDIPIPESFERVVRGQDTFDPELKVASARIDVARARMPPEHPVRALLARANFDWLTPGPPIVRRTPDKRDIYRIGPAPALLDRDHLAAVWTSVESIRHHRDATGRRGRKQFTANPRGRT